MEKLWASERVGVPVRNILINKSTDGRSNKFAMQVERAGEAGCGGQRAAKSLNAFINSIMNIAKISQIKNKKYGLARDRARESERERETRVQFGRYRSHAPLLCARAEMTANWKKELKDERKNNEEIF